jgi:hypothetical protein
MSRSENRRSDLLEIIRVFELVRDMGIIPILDSRVGLRPNGAKMNDETIKELFARQGQVIATLALRVTTLERLLLEKNIITEADAVKKSTELSKEFTNKVQDELRKVAEGTKRDSK